TAAWELTRGTSHQMPSSTDLPMTHAEPQWASMAGHVRNKQAMHGAREAPHGRGAASNPPNRFTPLWHVRDPDWTYPEDPAPTTQFFKDTARAILTSNASPDVEFTYSINPYRRCEHGCIYCYARPTHEYLGFSAGLDFDTRILVKH